MFVKEGGEPLISVNLTVMERRNFSNSASSWLFPRDAWMICVTLFACMFPFTAALLLQTCFTRDDTPTPSPRKGAFCQTLRGRNSHILGPKHLSYASRGVPQHYSYMRVSYHGKPTLIKVMFSIL